MELVLEREHSKVPEPEQVHSKVLELVHSMAREQVPGSKVLGLEQVHSMEPEPELGNMELVLVLEHSTALELGSMVLELVPGSMELGKLACSNADASGGYANAHTSSYEEQGSTESHKGPGSSRFHG